MRPFRIMFILVSSLVFCSTLIAQKLPPRDPQAVAILQQSFLAMGGANLAAFRDTEIHAQITAPKTDGPVTSSVTIKTMGTRSLRVEGTSANGPGVFTVNDQGAWSKVGAEPAQFISRKSVANGGITQLPLLSILADWNDSSVRVEYVGLEKLDNGAAHHVRLTPAIEEGLPNELESPCDIFLDSQSFLVVKLIYLVRPPSNLRWKVPNEVTYSDYRASAGIAVPFLVTYKIRGQLLFEYKITSFAVNRGAQPSDFEVR